MRVEFAHTADDFREAANRLSFREMFGAIRKGNPDATTLLLMFFLIFAGSIMMAAGAVYLALKLHIAWIVLAFPVVIVLWALISGLLQDRGEKAGREFHKDPRNADPAVAEFDDAAFRFMTQRFNVTMEWWIIRRFIETPNLLLLIDNTPVTYLIPKRAFQSEQELDACREMIRKHLSANAVVRLNT